jgi:hypothetical protein
MKSLLTEHNLFCQSFLQKKLTMATAALDAVDYAALYGIVGGGSFGFANWTMKGSPSLGDHKAYIKYYMLFAAMGCLSGALANVLFSNSGNSSLVGFVGGFLGSYVMLGVSVYN